MVFYISQRDDFICLRYRTENFNGRSRTCRSEIFHIVVVAVKQRGTFIYFFSDEVFFFFFGMLSVTAEGENYDYVFLFNARFFEPLKNGRQYFFTRHRTGYVACYDGDRVAGGYDIFQSVRSERIV